ncbi:MAG: tape measure protein, partial [Bosea sp. (in: a-proteobacteria)]
MSDVAVASVRLILDASLLPAQMGAAIAGLEAQAKAAGGNIEKSLAASTKGVSGSVADLKLVGAEITKIQKQINEQFSGKTNKDVQRSALERRVAAQQLAQDTKRNLDLLGETGKLNDLLAKEATNAHGVRLAELRAEQAELKNLDLAERNRATAASKAIDLQTKALRLSEAQRRAAESAARSELAQSKQLLTINQNLRNFGQPTPADTRSAERLAAQQAATQAKFAKEAERAAAQQLRDIERTAAANLRATEQFNIAQRRIVADADRQTASLERAARVDFSKQADGFRRLASTIGNASEAILKFGAISAATITATTGLIAGIGVKAAANFEQLGIGFESVLGAESGAATLELVKEFARQTPFATKEVAELSQKLIAVGLADAGSLEGFLETVAGFGAAAGVTSDNLDGLVRAITQIKGKGKLAGQELIQIAERAPQLNVLGLVSEKLGLTLQETYARLEEGAISADVAIGAIIDGMENFPGAATALSRQLDSLTGRWSELKDTITNTSAALTESSGLGDAVRETMRGITDTIVDEQGQILSTGLGGSLQQFYAEVARFAEQIGPQLGPLLGSLVDGLGNGLAEITPSLESLIGTLTELAPTIGDVAGSLGGQFLSVVETLAPVLVQFAEAISLIPGPLLALGFAAGKFAAPAANLVNSLNKLGGPAVAAKGIGAIGALTAGVSALGLASDDTSTQLGSLAATAASIGTAFATGGPVAGGIAAIGAGVGALVGVFQESSRQTEENRRAAKAFADTITAELVPALQEGAVALSDLNNAALGLFTQDIGSSTIADIAAINKALGKDDVGKLLNDGFKPIDLAKILAGDAGSLDAVIEKARQLRAIALDSTADDGAQRKAASQLARLEELINLGTAANDAVFQTYADIATQQQIAADARSASLIAADREVLASRAIADINAGNARLTKESAAAQTAELERQVALLKQQQGIAQGLADSLVSGVTNVFG